MPSWTDVLRAVLADKLADGTEARIAPQLRALVADDAALRRVADAIEASAPVPFETEKSAADWIRRRWPDLRPVIIAVFAQGIVHAEHDRPNA